ncbi:MAG TPA: hypothetical protein VGB25_08320 [Candidatus Binatia bacterium]
MMKTMTRALQVAFLALLFLSCGEAPKENKVRQAVEDVVTQDFKVYEGARRSLEGIEKSSQQRAQDLGDMAP